MHRFRFLPIIPGRWVLVASSVSLALVGLPLSFATGEVAEWIKADSQAAVPALQLWGALLLGAAVTNWMARGLLVGGIYGKAIVMGNLAHWATGAAVSVKLSVAGVGGGAANGAAIVYVLMAVAFLWLALRDPIENR